MYHGTTEEKWVQICQEGVLWGVRNAPSRCTYLTPMIDEARKYGEVLIEVQFNPELHQPHNYIEGCWQCRVYAEIPLECCRRID
jgi:hypothetical protein